MCHSSEVRRQKAAICTTEQFTTRKYEELARAAGLLGGAGAQRRCLRLCARLRSASRMDRHCWRELRWLHDLLCLQNVDDPDATDSAHYCDLAPDDPVVHDLCRLAEALGDLLTEIGSEQTQAVSAETDDTGQDAA